MDVFFLNLPIVCDSAYLTFTLTYIYYYNSINMNTVLT